MAEIGLQEFYFFSDFAEKRRYKTSISEEEKTPKGANLAPFRFWLCMASWYKINQKPLWDL